MGDLQGFSAFHAVFHTTDGCRCDGPPGRCRNGVAMGLPSKPVQEFFRRAFSVPKDLGENPAAQILTPVVRNRCRASVGMPEESMAPALADLYEA